MFKTGRYTLNESSPFLLQLGNRTWEKELFALTLDGKFISPVAAILSPPSELSSLVFQRGLKAALRESSKLPGPEWES